MSAHTVACIVGLGKTLAMSAAWSYLTTTPSEIKNDVQNDFPRKRLTIPPFSGGRRGDAAIDTSVRLQRPVGRQSAAFARGQQPRPPPPERSSQGVARGGWPKPSDDD